MDSVRHFVNRSLEVCMDEQMIVIVYQSRECEEKLECDGFSREVYNE